MWLLFALTAAVGMAGVDIQKKALAGKMPTAVVGWFLHGASLLIFIPILLVTQTLGAPSPSAWIVIVAAAVLTSFGLHFQQSAYAKGELSLLEPLQQLLPAVVVVASFFINRDLPSNLALLGIVLIMFGMYALRRHRHDHSLLDPIKHLFMDPAVVVMVLSIAFYGVSTAVDKFALNFSGPILYVAVLNGLLFVVDSFAIARDYRRLSKNWRKYQWSFMRLGLAAGVQQGAQIMALQTALAGNVIAIRDVGVIAVVWYGGRVLKEQRHWWQRWSASLILTVGAFLVAIAQGV